MKPLAKTILLSLLAVCLHLQAWAGEEERAFRVINAVNGLADNSAQIIKCTKTGRLIISTIGNLNFYDGKSFTHADSHAGLEYSLPLYRGHYHLYFDLHHHIWLKDKKKVTCLDLLTEHFVQNVDSVIRNMGCTEPVLDLFSDQHNNMWFFTSKGLFTPGRDKYYSVYRDRNLQDIDVFQNVLYCFYDNGEVVGQDSLGNVVCQVQPYDWDTGQNYAASSVLLPYGNGFFQIRNGDGGSILQYFHATTQTFTEVMRTEYHLNNMALSDNGSLLYIPCEYGYWVIDLTTHEKEHISQLQMTDGTLLNTDCNTLDFDHQGGMWIGTEKRGVLYARPHALAIRAYTWDNSKALEYDQLLIQLQQESQLEDIPISEYQGRRANCKFTDSRGWSWFGTRTGIYIERPGQPELNLTRRDGMSNDYIHSIVEDNDHNIWAATSCGISFFLINRGEVVFINSFTENDNVPNESFENCMAHKLPDGVIVMKALDHVVAFHPEELYDVNRPHLVTNIKPKLTKLLINGNYIEPNVPYQGSIIIDKALSRTSDITLQSDQNSVSMIFSALNYSRPTQTYYRVRVYELGNQWTVYSNSNSNNVDASGRLIYALPNLESGDYHIEVQASMFPDIWEENITDAERYVWTIHVKKPWWRTSGYLVLVGILLLTLLIVNFVYYNRNSRMRDRRNAAGGDIIKKMLFFTEQCEILGNQLLQPTNDDMGSTKSASLSPEFVQLMQKLIPYINAHQQRTPTMSELSKAGGVDLVKLYEIVMANLHKSPRELVRVIKLKKAAKLLRSTDYSVEQIAKEAGFYSPNYLIGNFYHQYKQTPTAYRQSKNAKSS